MSDNSGQHWPLPVAWAGTALFALGLIGMPFAMAHGHGRRQEDRAAIVGDTLLGTSWSRSPGGCCSASWCGSP